LIKQPKIGRLSIDGKIEGKGFDMNSLNANVNAHVDEFEFDGKSYNDLTINGLVASKKFDGIFMDTHDDMNYEKFEDYCKTIANENCILSIFNYFTFRKQSELNYYEYKVEPHKFTKLVSPTHTINWTYFKNGNFEKGDNVIKFKSPTSII
jgi:hypothetical protein